MFQIRILCSFALYWRLTSEFYIWGFLLQAPSHYCHPISMGSNGLSDASQENLDLQVQNFFQSAPPLKDRSKIEEQLSQFIQSNNPTGNCSPYRRIVCITSGGTTVPLEQRCVRYIDNFSSGHRGAASTEYFLKAGYSVIFLYRRGTCQPYCRALPDNPLLECFEASGSSVQVKEPHSNTVRTAIAKHQAEVAADHLLKIPFTTIFEYLQLLKLIAVSTRSLGPKVMFYLAAAVSDFYVPWESMVEHKIQSGSGPLDMRLAQAPKMLSVLRKEWAPSAFCISFKLETDSKILLEKAGMALQKYKMHGVVANELSTRKEEVTVVTSEGRALIQRDKSKDGNDVESPLIDMISERHSQYIQEFEV